jgi:CHASE2 domain-containing sensor protein
MVRHAVTAVKKKFQFYRWWARSRGVLWRGCLAWGIGCVILLSDATSSFDTRFQLRGPQPASAEIIVVKLSPSDLANFYKKRARALPPFNEITDITDSFYWDAELWQQLLNKVLAQNPSKVGVALLFTEALGPLSLSPEQKKIFYDSRIIWAGLAPTSDRTPNTLLGTYNKSNVGHIDLLRDEDGVIRRLISSTSENFHMAQKLTGVNLNPKTRSNYINFRGGPETYIEIEATDILSDQAAPSLFKNKIVIFGSESTSSSQFLTPLGSSSRSQILAQIVDNLLNSRWIIKAPVLFLCGSAFVDYAGLCLDFNSISTGRGPKFLHRLLIIY